MKKKSIKDYSSEQLDAMALDLTDVKPMSAAMRSDWEAAKKTGKRIRPRSSTARNTTAQAATSRVVPVSLEASLINELDQYARNAGMSRSRLIAEALRLRMNQVAG